MARRVALWLLGLEALAGIVFAILGWTISGTLLAFPFEQIGTGLRALSLSGTAGNVIAIIIYVVISLLPVTALVLIRRRGRWWAEDLLLALLAIVFFAVLYFMINPGILPTVFGSPAANASNFAMVAKAVAGGLAYSVICGYAVLRVLRAFKTDVADSLLRYLAALLVLIVAVLVWLIFGSGFADLVAGLKAVPTCPLPDVIPCSNPPTLPYAFLVVRFIVNQLAPALTIAVLFAAWKLLRSLRIDRYSADTVAASDALARLCRTALVVIVLANIGFNIVQVLCARWLTSVNLTVDIPVFELTLVLVALLASRLLSENKQLKDDNEMFI